MAYRLFRPRYIHDLVLLLPPFHVCSELLKETLPKLPVDLSLKGHWLAIEGSQPTVPENPPPVPKSQQKLEAVDPVAAKEAKG